MQQGIATLNEGLARLHDEVREYFPFVGRISAALYDEQTGEIKTFLHSPRESSPLLDYRIPLAKAHGLDEVRRSRRPRLIDNLSSDSLGDQEHGRRILAAGFRASYTVPIFEDDRFLGFVFIDSTVAGSLTSRVVRQLELFVRIVSLMIQNALRSVDVLVGGLRLLRQITVFRDLETSGHLARMSYYAERIARRVSPELGRDETWVEYVRLFAPLHDIGKIAIPDAILLKPGKLTDAEFETMKTHAVKGEKILTTLIRDLSLDKLQYVETLKHIARHHHERWDGEGYPDRLAGAAIPVEARIIHIADVFDALTSRRCYKAAWSVEDATVYLRRGAGREFDPRLVELFLEPAQGIASIMEKFTEEPAEAAEAT